MALLSGTRLGPYEVLSLLGSGGMGEVYRARDARLHRDVALKLLPATVAADPDRLARFTREAQVLAALNHPNIGAIYGIEESEGITALVLELVEGPTLAEQIAQGLIPLDDVLTIARQMADALEFAHEQGIIHRDLKPANVKLRPDGTVKVLDFGLAKAVGSPGTTSGVMADATQSPTFSAHATEAGIILGTAAYMSPEQARGRVVDRRADIWAFGAVLFEMLAGTRPFAGETISDTLAAIIKDAPPWDALPATILPEIRALLQRTLEKDPRRRLRDIGDARLALEDAQSGASRPAPPSPSLAGTSNRLRPWWRTVLPWAIAVAALVAMAWRRPVGPATSGQPLLKYTLEIPGLSLERHDLPALSPDGHALAFVKDHGLWVRGIEQLEAHQIAGASDPQNLFWSPDSRQVAYVSGGALWRAPLEGSPPARIAPFRLRRGGRTPGGVWRADGQIVFALAATGSGFLAVSSQGGELTEIYQRNAAVEGDFHRPSLLPDGRTLLFVVDRVDLGADTIGILSGTTRKDVLTIKGELLDSPVYSPSGHILFQRETTAPGVWAVPFSLDRLEVTGDPFIVAPQGSWPSVGSNGLLLYANDQLSGLEQLVWFDMKSRTITPALGDQFISLDHPSISPDGRKVAGVGRDTDGDPFVFVGDLVRKTYARVGEGALLSAHPTWRDNQTIVYARQPLQRVVGSLIVMVPADGAGVAVELAKGSEPHMADNTHLIFSQLHAGTGGDLWHMLLPPPGQPLPQAELLQRQDLHEWDPALSPDATLLAYSAGDPSSSEIMLRRYPEPTGRWQVSTNRGQMAVWNRHGTAIYYKDPQGLIYVVDVSTRPEVTLSPPRLVERPASLIAKLGFDVSPDGTKLLMVQEVKTEGDRGPTLAVVQNWQAEFSKK